MALSLHALAFWWLGSDSAQGVSDHARAQPPVLKLRLLNQHSADAGQLSAETRVEGRAGPQPSIEPITSSTPESAQTLGTEPSAATEPMPAKRPVALDADAAYGPVVAESEFVIEHPDSPLPGGKASARIALQVSHSGLIDGMTISSGALPEVFFEAVHASFVGRKAAKPAFNSKGSPVDSHLCLVVSFSEGEPPRWWLDSGKTAIEAPC